jgi:hypothetical protein
VFKVPLAAPAWPERTRARAAPSQRWEQQSVSSAHDPECPDELEGPWIVLGEHGGERDQADHDERGADGRDATSVHRRPSSAAQRRRGEEQSLAHEHHRRLVRGLPEAGLEQEREREHEAAEVQLEE